MKALLIFMLALCRLCAEGKGLSYSDIWLFGSVGKDDILLYKQDVSERYTGPSSSSETEIIFPDLYESREFVITFVGFMHRPQLHNVQILSGGIGRDRVKLLISRKKMHYKYHMPLGELEIYGRHKSCFKKHKN